MKVLSIQQPWAWLIVHGLKDIENRDWTTGYRGNLLIHAGQKFDPWALDLIEELLSKEEFSKLPKRQDYPMGGIVGVVKMTDVLTHSESKWFRGAYGWYFEQARPLTFYPLKGQLGLWEPHPAVLEAIKRECQRQPVESSSR